MPASPAPDRCLTQVVRSTWDGRPLAPQDRAVVQVVDADEALTLHVFAPFHDDPAPPGPPGPTPGLWEFEVVEWFVAGADDRYLEVELGPHGHHLVLTLHGVRKVVASALPMATTTRRCGRSWWSGTARLPREWLPPGPHRANAYRIHGQGPARVYHAAVPLPGPHPDFHQPGRFVPVVLPARGEPTRDRTLLIARVAALLDLDANAATAAVDAVPPVPGDLGRWTVAVLHALGIRHEDGSAIPDPIG